MQNATHRGAETRGGATAGPAFVSPRRETDPAVINAARLAALDRKSGRPMRKASAFVSLDAETRAAVDTACAAYHLNRQPQTLRGWACLENGPVRPLRINGRLAWAVADLRRLLGVEVKA